MRQSLIFPFLCLCLALLPSGFAQDVTQWRVPEEAVVSSDTTAINATALSLNGTQLAIATANGITLYDTYTGKELALFSAPLANVTALVFSPDNRTVASASGDATLHLWDVHTGEHSTPLWHTHPVVALAFSPDGNTRASGGFKEICLWDLTTEHPIRASVLHGHRDMVTVLAFSPDSKILASTSFCGTVLLWDVATGQRRHTLSAHTDSITALAFSPDNQTLASGGYWSLDAETTIRIWNIHTGQLLTTVEGHTAPVFTLAFSLDSGILASAGWDNAIHLWHPQTGQLRATFEGTIAPALDLAFLPESHSTYKNTLASVGIDCVIRLWPLTHQLRPWDANSDGVVNILDLAFVASRFGEDSPDLNGDGVVNILDLVRIAQFLGE